MDLAYVDARFEIQAPTGRRNMDQNEIRLACHELAVRLNYLTPDGHEKTVAIDKLLEVMSWAILATERLPAQEPNSLCACHKRLVVEPRRPVTSRT